MQCDLNLIRKYGMSARYKLQVTAIVISESPVGLQLFPFMNYLTGFKQFRVHVYL